MMVAILSHIVKVLFRFSNGARSRAPSSSHIMLASSSYTLYHVSMNTTEVSGSPHLLRIDCSFELRKVRMWVDSAQEDGLVLVHSCVGK